MRYVILGSGVAGVSAIEAIRSVDPSGEIVLVAEDPHGFYSRPGLAYYLTGEIPEGQLFPRRNEDWKRLKVQYLSGRAVRLFPQTREVEVLRRIVKKSWFSSTIHEEKFRLSYDRLLLATGSQASPLTVPGHDLQGVLKLDHLEDARQILRLARRGRRAVVIGGGITSLELVEGLQAQGVQVHYIMRGDRYWSNVLDETESHIVEERLKAEGVTLHHNAETAEILGRNGRVRGVRLADGKVIPCEMVAYAIGVRPRVELAQQADLNVDRGILVNEYLQTNVPEIYAAGDVAQVYDARLGKTVLDSLWTPAREQGYNAGLNMAGGTKSHQRGVAFNVTRLAGITTTIIGGVGHGRDADTVGIVRGDSETWRELPDAIIAQTGFEVNRLRLIVGSRTLLGAVIMGDQTLSWPLQRMIAAEVDITPIRSALLTPNAPLADLLVGFWSELTNRPKSTLTQRLVFRPTTS